MNIKDLSSWAKKISPSPTLAIDAKAKSMKASGQDICAFAAGEPDFDTPEFIKEACAKALYDGQTKYAPAAGILPLREEIAKKYANIAGVNSFSPLQAVVSPGGKFSCYLGILAVCDSRHEVIIPAPYWVSYTEMVKLAGAKPIILPTLESNDFKLTPEAFEESINPATRMLILNSPSNPTGAVYTKAEIEAIVEIAVRRKIYILSDEIYEHLLYDEVTHTSPISLGNDVQNWLITVSGFSKTFSMTGWRLGTLFTSPEIAKAVTSLQSQMTSNATTFAQFGALAAMQKPENSQQAIEEMKQVFDRRRIKLLEGLNAINGIHCFRSQGAFYLFPNIARTGLDSTTFSTRLLEETKTAVVPGSAFGADSNIRMSYAISDQVLDKGLTRLASFCNHLGQ